MVNVEQVLARFRAAYPGLKPRTHYEYAWEFRAFARFAKLDGMARRDVERNGRALIRAYLQTKARGGWRFRLARLRTVWEFGLGLSWPIVTKRDLGRLPNSRPDTTPPDEAVKLWAERMATESDPYFRLMFLLVAQHGWRRSHVCALEPADIRRDTEGKPVALVRYPQDDEFKTVAPIGARLAPDTADALTEWLAVAAKNGLGAGSLLPWRSAKNLHRMDFERSLDPRDFGRLWMALARRYNLPRLRPKAFRHWVATACRRAGLSKQATAFLMGHDSKTGGAMRDWYDQPQEQDALDEQALKLPYGPLGLLRPPAVNVEVELSRDLVDLVKAYAAGKLGTLEFVSQLEARARVSSRVGP